MKVEMERANVASEKADVREVIVEEKGEKRRLIALEIFKMLLPKEEVSEKREDKLEERDGVDEKEGEEGTKRKNVISKNKEVSKRIKENEGEALRRMKELEKCLFAKIGSTDGRYKRRTIEIYQGFQENCGLLYDFLARKVGEKEIIEMRPREMATEERKAEDSLLQLQALKRSVISQDQMAETDQFKCGKCGKRKATYYQLQIRSADEPMTTFVTCIVCGNKWKFS
eukprot:GHVN01059069.1.p1 GENE.GHVN01059069.1~~GHVN01059069.1.p1  ORF type:complete len:227 (+),score=43.13 GHVN01059069.1:3-683(+)